MNEFIDKLIKDQLIVTKFNKMAFFVAHIALQIPPKPSKVKFWSMGLGSSSFSEHLLVCYRLERLSLSGLIISNNNLSYLQLIFVSELSFGTIYPSLQITL